MQKFHKAEKQNKCVVILSLWFQFQYCHPYWLWLFISVLFPADTDLEPILGICFQHNNVFTMFLQNCRLPSGKKHKISYLKYDHNYAIALCIYTAPSMPPISKITK